MENVSISSHPGSPVSLRSLLRSPLFSWDPAHSPLTRAGSDGARLSSRRAPRQINSGSTKYPERSISELLKQAIQRPNNRLMCSFSSSPILISQRILFSQENSHERAH